MTFFLFEKLRRHLKSCHEQDELHGYGCCEIPETTCPPRCVGDLHFHVQRGSSAEATLLVRNVGLESRVFNFAASELAGGDVGEAKLTVTPSHATLAPEESRLVHVKLEDSLALHAMRTYHAEVTVRGSWEQCVKITCHVERDPFDAVSTDQGESLADKALHHHAEKHGIAWHVHRGASPTAKVTVHNAGKVTRTFSVQVTPLVGFGDPSASVVVSPQSMQLGAGQRTVLLVKLSGSASLAAGQRYDCALVVNGYYEQRIPIRTHVEPDASAYLEIEQGEAPTHRRAHHWYDHFQCTESCLPHGA